MHLLHSYYERAYSIIHSTASTNPITIHQSNHHMYIATQTEQATIEFKGYQT